MKITVRARGLPQLPEPFIAHCHCSVPFRVDVCDWFLSWEPMPDSVSSLPEASRPPSPGNRLGVANGVRNSVRAKPIDNIHGTSQNKTNKTRGGGGELLLLHVDLCCVVLHKLYSFSLPVYYCAYALIRNN